MSFSSLKKNIHWEYWPSYMFYVPLLPYAFYLAIKARSFGFFSAVNPGIEGSGNGLESKYDSIQIVPEKLKPKTVYIKSNSYFKEVLQKTKINNIRFPLIIKPDIGFRGLLVQKINSEKELHHYLKKFNSLNLIIQEFITFKNECGIFYHKIPGAKNGVITSITLKKYLTVIGNGKSSILELIKNDDRAKIYLALISELNKDRLYSVPLQNKEIVLNVIGNHSKGTQFINGNHLISNELTNTIDKINDSISGWHYGRIDIKYTTFEELIRGENFKIIEINGVISEPTHIYDASKGTYLDALKAIKKHWKILYIIGVKNKKLKKAAYTNFTYLIALYFRYKKYIKKINNLSVR